MKKKLLNCIVFGYLIGSAMSCSDAEGMDFTPAYAFKAEDSDGVRAIKAAAKAFKFVDEKAAAASVYFEDTTGRIRFATWLSDYRGDERDGGNVLNALRNRGLESTARFLGDERQTLQTMCSGRFGKSMAEQWGIEFFPRFEESLAADITTARTSFGERSQRLGELHGEITVGFANRSALLLRAQAKEREYLDLAAKVPVAAGKRDAVQRALAGKISDLASAKQRLQEISGQTAGEAASQASGGGIVLWTSVRSKANDQEKLSLQQRISALTTEIEALRHRLGSIAAASDVQKGLFAKSGEELEELRAGLLRLNRDLYGLSENVFDLTASWGGMTEALQTLIGMRTKVTPAFEQVREIGGLYESLFEGVK